MTPEHSKCIYVSGDKNHLWKKCTTTLLENLSWYHHKDMQEYKSQLESKASYESFECWNIE